LRTTIVAPGITSRWTASAKACSSSLHPMSYRSDMTKRGEDHERGVSNNPRQPDIDVPWSAPSSQFLTRASVFRRAI
jgi:hypothetical protein